MVGAPNAEKNSSDAKPAAVADVGAMARSAAANRVQEELQKPRRGRPPGTGSKASGTSAAPPASQLTPELAAQIEGMFKPEAWAPLMSLPADAMLALTGNDWWNVKESERVAMGATASCAARFLVTQHPRTLAVIMVSAAVLSVYAPRILKEAASRRPKKEEKQK